MTIKKTDLIQTGRIVRPLSETKGERFSRAVSTDCMGNARFEFGVMSESLRAFEPNMDKIRVRLNNEVVDDDLHSLRMLSFMPDDEWEEYLKFFRTLMDGSHWTEENTKLDPKYWKKNHPNFVTSIHSRCDVWWDLDNHVIWSFDKIFMNRVSGHIAASLEYMNSQVKQ